MQLMLNGEISEEKAKSETVEKGTVHTILAGLCFHILRNTLYHTDGTNALFHVRVRRANFDT